MKTNHIPFLMFMLLLGAAGVYGGSPAQRDPEIAGDAKPCRIESCARPHVLTTAARIEFLKKELAQDGNPRRDYYNRVLKANADRWLPRPIEIPGRSGSYHAYVCSDGTRLETHDQTLGFRGPYRCPVCGKTYTEEKYAGGYRNLEHIWLMTACRDLALVAALEGNRSYAEKAAEILRKYADAYPGRHTKTLEGGIFSQSLDESMHIIKLAQAYDLIADTGVLTPVDKDHIEKDLFWECAEGLRIITTPIWPNGRLKMGGNWGAWHLAAVGTIGYATRHQGFIDFAERQFKRLISTELGSDGLWPESVHTYHFFTLQAFLFLTEAAANTGTDLYHETIPGRQLQLMFQAPLAYMYPNLQLPAINDGWYSSYIPADLYDLAYTRYRLPEFAWVVQERLKSEEKGSAGSAGPDEMWSFIHHERFPGSIVAPNLVSANFRNLGVAALRSDPGEDAGQMMITFDYGPWRAHGQADAMGITLFARGGVLAADYGTPSYGSSMTPFYQGTPSHNVVIVDGRNQASRTPKSDGFRFFGDAPGLKAVSALSDEVYPGVEWQRSVLLAKTYALVVDELRSAKPHEYDWLFHCEGDRLRLDAGGAGEANPEEFRYRYLTNAVRYVAATNRWRCGWETDRSVNLMLTAACEPGDRFYEARCPAETAVRTVPLLVWRKKAARCRFVALLYPPPGKITADRGRPEISPVLRIEEAGRIAVEIGNTVDRFSVSSRSVTWEQQQAGTVRGTIEFK